MARTDAVIVVQTRPIALRTLLAVMLAITLALSMIVPSGGAPAVAEETSGDDGSLVGLGDLIEVDSVEFVEQPVDAVLVDDSYYPVTATPGTETAVTVEWTYSRTATFHQATDIATGLLRQQAVEKLFVALDIVASDTFGTTAFASGTTATIDTVFRQAVESWLPTSTVATLLDVAIANAIATETSPTSSPDLIAWDVAGSPEASLTTTTTAATSVRTATGSTPTVVTAFTQLEVDGPETRRRVELRLALQGPIDIRPDWTIDVSGGVPLHLATVSTGTETTLTLVPVTATTPTTVTIDTKVSLDGPSLTTSIDETQTSDEFRLWETATDCTTTQVCRAEVGGSVVDEDEETLGEVRVAVRNVDDANEGRLLLGWLGDREVPGATATVGSWNAQLTCNGVDYQGLPGTILFDAPGVVGEKLLTVQVPRSIVQLDTNNGRAQYDVCFLGEGGLAFRDGATPSSETSGISSASVDPQELTDPFLLPTCGERTVVDGRWERAPAPCIESRTAVRSANRLDEPWRTTLRGGLEIVIRLPEGDPMFR